MLQKNNYYYICPKNLIQIGYFQIPNFFLTVIISIKLTVHHYLKTCFSVTHIHYVTTNMSVSKILKPKFLRDCDVWTAGQKIF